MTIYIPTSSLNLSNILSNESISPKSFYTERGFGITRFFSLDNSTDDNSIVMYEECPEMKLLYKHRLGEHSIDASLVVLAVDLDSCNLSTIYEYKKGIYICTETIYINPFNTKIYFFDKTQMNIALSDASSSAEVKVYNLYQNNISIFKGRTKKYEKVIGLTNAMNCEAIEKDIRINRLKGFAYSYIVGANTATTEVYMWASKVLKEIINLSCAIINSPSGKGTESQREELERDLRNMAAVTLYEKLGSENTMKQLESISPYIDSQAIFGNLLGDLQDKERNDSAIKCLKEYLESKILKHNKKPFRWENIAFANCQLTQFEDNLFKKRALEYYKHTINDVLLMSDVYENTFATIKLEIATDITKDIKKIMEEKGEVWEDSKERKVFNQLRRSLSGEEEPPRLAGIEYASSLVVFLIAECKESKISELIVTRQIYDARLIWGMYGCVSGYASLSRSLTDVLYLSEDMEYLTYIYKLIFKQLHNVDLEGELNSLKTSNRICDLDNKTTDFRTFLVGEDVIDHTIEDFKTKLKESGIKSNLIPRVINVYVENRREIDEVFYNRVINIKGFGDISLKKLKKYFEKEDLPLSNEAELDMWK